MIKLAIVGSKLLINHPTVEVIINAAIEDLSPDIVISGGAVGVDASAEKIAKLHGYQTPETLWVFTPENPVWEPNGYKDRNTLIATNCTHLLCIRYKYATTYGSGWTRDLANRLGKIIVGDHELPR